MKGVIATCGLIVTLMFISVGYQYHRFNEIQNQEVITNESYPFTDVFESSNDTVSVNELPEWCSDSDYVGSVVVPMQEEQYNIEISDELTMDSSTKFLICQDSHACGVHETLYDKWSDAKELKIQMVRINTKLDSLEKKY